MTQEERKSIKIQCEKIILHDEKMKRKFSSYSEVNKKWVLDCLLSGKGTVLYEMINRFNYFDNVLEKEFSSIEQLYLKLKGNIISEEEY